MIKYIYGFIAAIVALVVSILKHQRDAARVNAATAERDAAKRDARDALVVSILKRQRDAARVNAATAERDAEKRA